MKIAFHHAHLFESDIDPSIRFYREMFGAEVLFDRIGVVIPGSGNFTAICRMD